MKVLVAKSIGFCPGVAAAVTLAIDGVNRYGWLHADGPLIHNHQATDALERRGVVTLREVPSGAPVLIRAHGVPPRRVEELQIRGHPIVDATCGRVTANQRFAAESAKNKRSVVVAGDPGHAEVAAILGSAGADSFLVSTPEQAESLSGLDSPVLLAQTTFDPETFRRIAAVLRGRYGDLTVRSSLCGQTRLRLAETRRLAEAADCLVVVGGRHSANTRRLAEAGRQTGKPVFAVETAEELRSEDFVAFAVVGVAAGASTPRWVIDDVIDALRPLGKNAPPVLLGNIVQVLAASRLGICLSVCGWAMAVWQLAGTVIAWPWVAATALAAFFGGEIALFFQTATRVSSVQREVAASLAWATMIVLPLTIKNAVPGMMLALLLLFVFCLRFGAGLVCDLYDPAGDLLRGKNTTLAAIGVKPAEHLAMRVFMIAIAIPAGFAAYAGHLGEPFTELPLFALCLTAAAGMEAAILEKVLDRSLNDLRKIKALLAGTGFLAGLLALLFGIWS